MASGINLTVGDKVHTIFGKVAEIVAVSGLDLVVGQYPNGNKITITNQEWLQIAERIEGAARSTRTVSPTGALRDNGNKPQLSYVPLDLCDGAARIMTYGAAKYARNNWRKGYPPVENLDSLIRHLTQLQLAIENEDKDGSQGFLFDPDHGESQASALLVNVWFIINSMRKAGYKV